MPVELRIRQTGKVAYTVEDAADAGDAVKRLYAAGQYDFSSLDLRGVILEDAKLNRAILSDARLDGAILDDAELTGATLDGCFFAGCSMISAILDGASLRCAFMDRSYMGRASFVGADLTGVYARRAVLERAVFTGADLAYVNFDNSCLRGANLDGVSLERTVFKDTDLSDATLQGARLNWQSHDLIAHILRSDPGCQGIQREVMVAVIAGMRDLCWKEFANLQFSASDREWALGVLSKWGGAPDYSEPLILRSWMAGEPLPVPVNPLAGE